MFVFVLVMLPITHYCVCGSTAHELLTISMTASGFLVDQQYSNQHLSTRQMLLKMNTGQLSV